LASKPSYAILEFASSEVVEVNGEPGVILRNSEGKVTNVVTFEIVDARIQQMFAIRNPDKLSHIP
jgi:RNA polymerase sigma-70 factor, ECF subfamily